MYAQLKSAMREQAIFEGTSVEEDLLKKTESA
jgi:hypothetical protein